MHDNHVYNLLEQLSVELKSLWRMSNMYPKDSLGCKDCEKLWDDMKKSKEKNIERLTNLVKNHLK